MQLRFVRTPVREGGPFRKYEQLPSSRPYPIQRVNLLMNPKLIGLSRHAIVPPVICLYLNVLIHEII